MLHRLREERSSDTIDPFCILFAPDSRRGPKVSAGYPPVDLTILLAILLANSIKIIRNKNGMNIPTRQECFNLMHAMKMMDHIKAHSIQVCRVALALAAPLQSRSGRPDLELLRAAALLHDITKTRSFTTGEKHASTGAELMETLGYPELGHIIGQHVQLDVYFSSTYPTEAEILNYADKRVLHDKVVSLEKRMDYIYQRYGKTDKDRRRLENLHKLTETLEGRIFRFLAYAPADLINNL